MFPESAPVIPGIVYFPAPVAAWIEVTDEDSADFLQSQFSNDLAAGPGQATYGLWLDHRGKIQGDSTILQLAPERFFLYSWATAAETLKAKLEAHIVADEVVLEDRTESAASLVIWGDDLAPALRDFGFSLPARGKCASADECLLFAAHTGPEGAWQIVGPAPRVEQLREALSGAGARAQSAEDYQGARIAAGIPLVPAEVGPAESPIEAGLEHACSWTKGCFLGQEVVARQHRLERRSHFLTIVRVEGTVPSLPVAIHTAEGSAGSLRALGRQQGVQRGLALLKPRIRQAQNVPAMSIEGQSAEVFVDD